MTNIDRDEILMVWILIIVQWNLYLCCVIPTNQVVYISFKEMKNGHKTTMVWFLIIL
jgi:hypothetical protein